MSRNSAFFQRRCCPECGTVTDSGEMTITRGNLTLDRALRRVTWRGEPVHLTLQQFGIVELLVQREGRVVENWSFFGTIIDEDVEAKVLEVQICRLRKSFRSVDPEFDQLETIRSTGFMWRRDLVSLNS